MAVKRSSVEGKRPAEICFGTTKADDGVVVIHHQSDGRSEPIRFRTAADERPRPGSNGQGYVKIEDLIKACQQTEDEVVKKVLFSILQACSSSDPQAISSLWKDIRCVPYLEDLESSVPQSRTDLTFAKCPEFGVSIDKLIVFTPISPSTGGAVWKLYPFGDTKVQLSLSYTPKISFDIYTYPTAVTTKGDPIQNSADFFEELMQSPVAPQQTPVLPAKDPNWEQQWLSYCRRYKIEAKPEELKQKSTEAVFGEWKCQRNQSCKSKCQCEFIKSQQLLQECGFPSTDKDSLLQASQELKSLMFRERQVHLPASVLDATEPKVLDRDYLSKQIEGDIIEDWVSLLARYDIKAQNSQAQKINQEFRNYQKNCWNLRLDQLRNLLSQAGIRIEEAMIKQIYEQLKQWWPPGADERIIQFITANRIVIPQTKVQQFCTLYRKAWGLEGSKIKDLLAKAQINISNTVGKRIGDELIRESQIPRLENGPLSALATPGQLSYLFQECDITVTPDQWTSLQRSFLAESHSEAWSSSRETDCEQFVSLLKRNRIDLSDAKYQPIIRKHLIKTLERTQSSDLDQADRIQHAFFGYRVIPQIMSQYRFRPAEVTELLFKQQTPVSAPIPIPVSSDPAIPEYPGLNRSTVDGVWSRESSNYVIRIDSSTLRDVHGPLDVLESGAYYIIVARTPIKFT